MSRETRVWGKSQEHADIKQWAGNTEEGVEALVKGSVMYPDEVLPGVMSEEMLRDGMALNRDKWHLILGRMLMDQDKVGADVQVKLAEEVEMSAEILNEAMVRYINTINPFHDQLTETLRKIRTTKMAVTSEMSQLSKSLDLLVRTATGNKMDLCLKNLASLAELLSSLQSEDMKRMMDRLGSDT